MKSEDLCGVLLFALLLVALISIGCVLGISSSWKKACVEHKAAHWVVDGAGKTTFAWNEEVK
jgi:hypothetical protein